MFSGTVAEELLPNCIVYKPTNLWCVEYLDDWQAIQLPTVTTSELGGLMLCFDDWFGTAILSLARRKEVPKVIVVDNWSSHF